MSTSQQPVQQLALSVLDGPLKGKVFSKGYFTAERFGQNGEKKIVFSLQKDKSIEKISNNKVGDSSN